MELANANAALFAALLVYVAQHILTALTRRQVQEDLERRVGLRTQELARANRELVAQVQERMRQVAATMDAGSAKVSGVEAVAGAAARALEEIVATVERVREGEAPSAVIASYGFSRTTIYKWLAIASKPGVGLRALASRPATTCTASGSAHAPRWRRTSARWATR